jgi:hypothetical protein
MHELDKTIEPQVKAFKRGLENGKILQLKYLIANIEGYTTISQFKGLMHTELERLESESE